MKEKADVIISMPEAPQVSAPSLTGNTSGSSKSEAVTLTGMDPNLYKAAVEGKVDAFQGKGNEIESILTPNKNTILHIHLTNYSVSEAFVRGILGMCPSLLTKANAKRETLLHTAARYGHSRIVSILIERDRLLIRATNSKNETALHEAVCYHHTEIVDVLTREDPYYSYFGNSDGETPLYIAAERAYWDVVLKILENCGSPNQNGPNGRTALHAAVLHNNKEMVSKLLTWTTAKQADENGWVPLHLAALYRPPDLANTLLTFDRNMAYKQDKEGRTALHIAARCGNKNTVQKIIEHCPDCSELVDNRGCNALHYTVPMARKLFAADAATARMILNNASLSNLYNERDDNGNTPLHYLASTTPIFEDVYDDHPLLKGHPRVDTVAFNKHNQTALDLVHERCNECRTYSKTYLLDKMRKIGARYGGRVIINEDDSKMEEEKGQGSEVDRKKKQGKGDNWLDRLDILREANFVVAALIATVTFTAGFTLPGGVIQQHGHDQPNKGIPKLNHNAAFQAFVISDSISLVLSASAVLLQIYSSFPRVRKEVLMYVNLTEVNLRLTMWAMAFMIVAFVTGTYAVLGDSIGHVRFVTLIGLFFFLTFIRGSWANFKLAKTSRENDRLYFSNVPDRPILDAEQIQLSNSDL